MAYPGEKQNVEYMQYLERHDMGEENGPRLSKEEWLKKNPPADPRDNPRDNPPANPPANPRDSLKIGGAPTGRSWLKIMK